ncbi:hypothetical protein F0562_019062 [Nyssa sinensis]|uniref:Fe2OG dioxygenase domain-containing protein n=1 Tax=Nyssa sinensis TaxID=561372 RepID=A0A5J4ZAS6_9ASTE|nr:hypothetical protein F0562_019062 [Nyssa sinensis]
MGSQSLAKFPIVDFSSENLKPGTSSWIAASNDVRHALEEYGCFVAVYNKVSLELGDAIFGALKELFDLPTETKVQKTSDKPYFDYVGKDPNIPLYEGLGIDNAASLEGTQSFTNVMWPHGNDHFCETLYSFTKLASEVEQMVKRMVFESYGVEKCYESQVGSTTYILRVMKYRGPHMNETNIGVVNHTDKSFITILHQNQVNGLEMRFTDINVKQKPTVVFENSFALNQLCLIIWELLKLLGEKKVKVMASQTVPKLPVVDFTKGSLKPGSSSWLSTCNDVRHALEEYGCFVALYDKVSRELDKEVFGALKDLFDLPTETKVQNTSDKLYYGYVGTTA